MNTYKTFSEISTNQNETQKINTSINTINLFNNNCSTSINNNNNILLEEEFKNFKINKNNKNTIYKTNGILD